VRVTRVSELTVSELNETMLKLLALDPNIQLLFSMYTRKWYVHTRASVTNGTVVRGICEHRDNPWDAVLDFWWTLQTVTFEADERIVLGHDEERRHFYWNGAAFAEEPVSVLMGRT
jgi:hypothetical protein